MRGKFHLPLVLALTVAAAFAADGSPLSLFDGTTLAGWKGNAAHWRVEDGALTGEIAAGQTLASHEFIAWTGGEVGDFELTLEFKLGGAAANSGVQFRAERLPDGTTKGYQADIDGGAVWLGRIFDEGGRRMLAERGTRASIAPDGRTWSDAFARPEDFKNVLKRDAWNSYHVSARASHIEVRVNDVLVSALDDHQSNAARTTGRLALQLHRGAGPVKVQFRNLRLTQLGRTGLPPAASAPAGTATDALVAIAPTAPDGSALNLGFETGTLEGWKVEGNAWRGQPVSYNTANPPKRRDESGAGTYWIGFVPPRGDGGTGRLTSAPFVVSHPWASFLVGGNENPSVARVEIVSESTDAVLHRAAGQNTEAMRREVVDFSGHRGQRIFVRLVDNGTGPAHVTFDDFVFHAEKPVFAESVVGDAHRLNESPVLWHLRPNPAAPTAVASAAAQHLVAGLKLTNGFKADLVAAEPDVRQPIAFAIDERGRLWVAEAYGYPLRQREGQGKDRIVIFEDADGDGTFETRKVFIEKLNLVSGLEVGFGGVWVGAAPHFLFIPDRDRDDRPDGEPEVLLDGWGYQDTHETLNSFTWGPDGWLYGCHGVFTHSRPGRPGTPDTERTDLRAGVWRYHPVRREFEIFAHGGSNQWGLDFNSLGHLFMTHCRSFHGGGGTTYVIRNGHYWNQANANYAPFVSNAAPAFAPQLKNFLPASARYDSGEGGAGKPGTGAIFGGHSHVGTMIYLGDNWPEIYRDHLFTHNLHGHQLNHQVNRRVGSAYETFHAGYDLLFSADPTYLPVDLQYGPDGAVYVIDWTDNQHCHNTAVERWDRNNGRIYRLAWAETFRPTTVNLARKSDLELVELHGHRNEWFARTARRLLQERAAAKPLDPRAIAALRAQFAKSADVAMALRALFTLHVAGALDRDLVATALQHSSDVVRGHAVALATERAAAALVDPATLARLAASDPSASVRLALAAALPAVPPAARWEIAAALAQQAGDADDRFLPKMIWFGLATVAADDVSRALALATQTKLPSLADSIRWFAARTPAGREQVAAFLAQAREEDFAHALGVFAFSLEKEADISAPAAWPQVLARARRSSDPAALTAGDRLAAMFGDKSVLAKIRARVANEALPLAERRSDIAVLKRAEDREALPLYLQLLAQAQLRADVIPLLAGWDDPEVAAALLKVFPELSNQERFAAFTTLTGRPAHAVALLTAVQEKRIDRDVITPFHTRQLRSMRDPAVMRLVERVWSKPAETGGATDAKATIARFEKRLAGATATPGELDLGKQVFQRACSACHTMNGEGGKFGPDLTGSWSNGVNYFIENIVDPNAVVGENFQLNVITKRDGTVLSGMIDSQTDTALVIRTMTETVTVAKSDIKERQVTSQSLMPGGLLEGISEAEAVALLKFLAQRP